MSETPKSKNRITKAVIVFFIFLVPVMIASFVGYDVFKSPWQIYGDLKSEKLNQGYDLVCHATKDLQLCLMNHTSQNLVGLFKDNVRVEYLENPCINLYLTAYNQSSGITRITDHFGVKNDTDASCAYAIRFNSNDGWHFGHVTNEAGFNNDTNQGLYYAGKSLSCGPMTKLINGTCMFDGFYSN